MENKIRYRSVQSDGDANTITAIHTLNPYLGSTVEKQECVNHVAKRVGKGLRTAVDDVKQKRITLGGKGEGQLTEKKMTRQQKYYRKAVLSHSDVPSMRLAIWATIEHCSSTDDDLKHSHCHSIREPSQKVSHPPAINKIYQHT